MTRNLYLTWLVAGSLLPALTTGCLKRKEQITIAPDGGVTMTIEYEGEADQFLEGDALPSAETGWEVERKEKEKKDGSKEVSLTGRQVFAPGAALPSSYADPNDPDADLYLAFPTTVRFEERADGMYVHFHRRYEPRRWAYVQYWHDLAFDDSIREQVEKPLEELTRSERIEIARAFAGFEAMKHLTLFEKAIEKLETVVPPDHWLAARRAWLDVYEAIDWDGIVAEYEQLPEGERDEFFAGESKRILDRAREAMRKGLARQPNWSFVRAAVLEAAYDREHRHYGLTERLAGHAFEICVKMPGQVVAHNGDSNGGDGNVCWSFDGRAFRDRAHDLRITSRLEAGGAPGSE